MFWNTPQNIGELGDDDDKMLVVVYLMNDVGDVQEVVDKESVFGLFVHGSGEPTSV